MELFICIKDYHKVSRQTMNGSPETTSDLRVAGMGGL